MGAALVTIEINKPLVSVVMACYQEALQWLDTAVDSILKQTFNACELIVVVDDPNNQGIISLLNEKRKTDQRLKVLINEQNMGLPRSLNRGFAIASGEFFARMDADDIAAPQRLELQVHYFTENPEVDLLGTAITNIDQAGNILGVKQFLTQPEAIKKAIAYRSVACHPTWMMKRSVYDTIGGYRYFPSSEDYDFLYRVLDAGFKVANLPQPLLEYRLHDASMTSALSGFQYKVKHYIQALHQQRETQSLDSYDEKTSQALKQTDKGNDFAKGLITKARTAEESGNFLALAYWGSIAVVFSGSGYSRLKSFVGFNYIKWRYEK
jgi:glycosyltransferase involved in cell wall biosynthesis